ncbi:CDP-glycerol glycerophosphotransferase family protein [Fusobacterium nucleatum]|uniref:CDP-glycerol glycerophosphotransferase family protein n=1 Tax=Fusobacterium nucleatum subsp. polymorphum TaxID=76857 RepID=UPI00291FD6E7|nr:CDP-glycerol glycerophosphotransferase family protein [Fusobacterium nucleatum]BEP02353.1 CDP-glycerol glycerophosphotransferase family protein [Fusobacterium nucleatum]
MKNTNKYIYIRLMNFIRGIIFSFLYIFIKKNKKRIIFTSTGNTKYDHNSKYLFEYFLKYYPDFDVKYVINEPNLKNNLEEKIGNYFINTNSIKGMLYSLKAYTWITSSIELPVGGIFQRINRLVIHLGHGTPLKNIGFLEKNISTLKKVYYILIKNNFSYVLSTSYDFDKIMSKFLNIPLKRIFTNGQPRLDSIFEKKEDILNRVFKVEKNMKNILYAPTWRQDSETKLFPFSDFNEKEIENFLEDNKINIFLRVHPDFETEIDEKLLKIKGIYVLNSKVVKDISEYLSCFDLLITDYSSIFIDYLLLDKPILFLPYDFENYNKEIGFTVDYMSHTPGPKSYTFKSFKNEIIELLNNNEYFYKERIKDKTFYNLYTDNRNCERVSKFILENL